MTATYQKHGIQFLYPENWRLIDEADGKLPDQVSIHSPTGGFWSLQVFPAETPLKTLLKQLMSELQQQYGDVEFSNFGPGEPDASATGVDALFYCLDFLIAARVQVMATPSRTLAVWYQAENREFDANEQVFRAITISLMRNL